MYNSNRSGGPQGANPAGPYGKLMKGPTSQPQHLAPVSRSINPTNA